MLEETKRENIRRALRIRKIDRMTVEGKWEERVLFGVPVRFKIRPKTDAITKEIREEHKRRENGSDVYDEPAISDALIDYALESFEFFDEAVCLEGKKKLLFMELPSGELMNYFWVMDRAVHAGIEVYDAALKN